MISFKILLSILLVSIIHQFCVSTAYVDLRNFDHDHKKESQNEYWLKLGRDEINRNLKLDKSRKAKNVILYLGDGMGVSTITASRILKGQLNNRSGEEGYLYFERNLPYTALIKTYNVDRLVPDSAGTATGYLSGVKSYYEVIGVNAAIYSSETDCEKIKNNKVVSIMEMARREGKAIGVVTTTRITHATPSASYAHVAHRDHESFLPEITRKAGCKDIATQLIEDEPGASFNVILGGGLRHFLPGDPNSNYRTDNVNLIKKWTEKKAKQYSDDRKYKFVKTVDELNKINPDEVEHLFGLFNLNHITYNHSLPKTKRTEPTLREMSDMAIKVLSKYEKGFVLLVEGGRIDLASHDNNAFQALYETVHFDETIESGMKLVNKNETLVLVTADHSHTLVINGYPKRGTNIFGFTDRTEMDNQNKSTSKEFTILAYGNGPGHTFGELRPDPSKQENLGTETFINYAAVRLDASSHGGEDVALFSSSWPNLVRGVKEQNYVAHIMAYTSCIGPYTDEPHCKDEETISSSSAHIWTFVVVAIVIIFIIAFYVLKRNHYV